MRAVAVSIILGVLAVMLGGVSRAGAECASDGPTASHCLYRSLLPSTGIVASCRDDRDCRVGHYYGDPGKAVWIEPPAGMATLPKPEVTWPTLTFAQIRFDCGPACSVSYFFEAKRRRLSGPRRFVLAVDVRRWMLAAAEERALVVRQVFSGREVARIERDWAPGGWLGDVITALHFDPDGRLSFTWLRGPDRAAVSERLSIPAAAAP
jgi:hypothetical protein